MSSIQIGIRFNGHKTNKNNNSKLGMHLKELNHTVNKENLDYYTKKVVTIIYSCTNNTI